MRKALLRQREKHRRFGRRGPKCAVTPRTRKTRNSWQSAMSAATTTTNPSRSPSAEIQKHSTPSSARFTLSPPHARIAAAASSGTGSRLTALSTAVRTARRCQESRVSKTGSEGHDFNDQVRRAALREDCAQAHPHLQSRHLFPPNAEAPRRV